LPILSITLQRHPCPLGRQNYWNKDRCGSTASVTLKGLRVRILRVKKNRFEKNSNFFRIEDRCWMSVIEKKGLYQAAEILENYGINSETDVSMLDRDDFYKLVSGGLRPLEAGGQVSE
jgi:hypothetical protein